MPLDMEKIFADFPDAEVDHIDLRDLPPDGLNLDHSDNEHWRGAVFVLDEIWQRWQQGDRANQLSSGDRSFFAEHRHFVGQDGFSTEIVIVCQSLNQVTAFIRELVDTTYITSKLDKLGSDGKFRTDIYSGPQTLTRPNRDQHIRSTFGTYRKSVYDYYRSHTRNRSGFAHGTEQSSDSRNRVWKSPVFVLGLPIALVSFVAAGLFLVDFFTVDRAHAETTSLGSDSPPPAPVAVSVRSTTRTTGADDRIPLSEEWRLGGIIWSTRNFRKGWAILINSDDDQRTIPLHDHCTRITGTVHDFECIVDGERITTWSGDDDHTTLL
jgi:zona occludens toxin